MHPASDTSPAGDGGSSARDRHAAIAAFARRLEAAVAAGLCVASAVPEGFCLAAPRWGSSGLLAVENGRTVRLVGQHGNDGDLFDGLPTRWPLATSPAKRVLESGRPFTCADITAEPEFPLYRMDAALVGYRAVTLLPLGSHYAAGETPSPVLLVTLHSARSEAAGPEELALLEALAAIASLALTVERRSAAVASTGPEPAGIAAVLARLDAERPRLAATAAAFALSGGRYQATADRLGLHVSTIRYRLDRLARLHGLDLGDEATRNAVAAVLSRSAAGRP